MERTEEWVWEPFIGFFEWVGKREDEPLRFYDRFCPQQEVCILDVILG